MMRVGWLADGPLDGNRLSLPPFLEPRREQIVGQMSHHTDTDGTIEEIGYEHRHRPARPEIVLLCDVSGSVAGLSCMAPWM